MTSNVCHCFCIYCTQKRCLLHFNIRGLLCHTASCRAQQCLKHDQKYKTKTKTKTKAARPRPRPRSVWDRSCHKTAVSDPRLVMIANMLRIQIRAAPINSQRLNGNNIQVSSSPSMRLHRDITMAQSTSTTNRVMNNSMTIVTIASTSSSALSTPLSFDV